MEMRGFKDEVARVDRNAEQVAARKKRQTATDAALERVRSKESAARQRAPERREQEQARKQREAKKAAANQRVADASKAATLSNVTSKGSRLGGQKQTMNTSAKPANAMSRNSTGRSAPAPQPTPESQPPQLSKPKSRKDDGSLDTQIKSQRLDDMKAKRAQRDADYANKRERQAKRAREEGAKDTVDKRKSGVGAGVKSALGGDMFMRNRKGDSEETKAELDKRRGQSRADFGKKKTQQFGNFVKSAGRAALTDKDQDRTQVAGASGDVSGGSSYQSRTQRN